MSWSDRSYNSRWARPALNRLLNTDRPIAVPPMLVVIWFGANDACLADRSSSRQHVPLDEYQSNLKALTDAFRDHGCSRILLVSPPPPHLPSRMSWLSSKYGNNAPAECPIDPAVTEKYAAACRTAANEAGLLGSRNLQGFQIPFDTPSSVEGKCTCLFLQGPRS